jgi:hypothetical protein
MHKVLAGTVSILSLLLLFQACPALADCTDGARQSTAQEQRFHSRVLSAIEAAMPDAPDGWEIVSATDIDVLETVCIGGESLPMYLAYRIEYRRVDRMEEMEEELVETAAATMNPQEGEQARLDALQVEQELLARELEQAMATQDFARLESIGKRMEAVGRKMDAVYQAMDQRMEQATEEKLLRDVKAMVIVEVNAGGNNLDSPERIKLSGTDLAFRIGDGRRRDHLDWQEGITRIYLGPWRTETDGELLLITPVEQTVGHTEVRTLSLTVQAERSRSGDLLEAMDLTAMKGLLKR